MKVASITLRDKHGWPIESVKGKTIANIMKAVMLTNVKKTIQRRYVEG